MILLTQTFQVSARVVFFLINYLYSWCISLYSMRTLQSSNITSIAVEVIYDLPNHTFRDANYYPTHTLKNNQLKGFLLQLQLWISISGLLNLIYLSMCTLYYTLYSLTIYISFEKLVRRNKYFGCNSKTPHIIVWNDGWLVLSYIKVPRFTDCCIFYILYLYIFFYT